MNESHESHLNESETFSELSSSKKCPVCGRELDTVYMTGFKGIVGLRPYTTKNIPALKCEHCRIVILSYKKTVALGEFLKRCVGCGKEIPLASGECQYCGASQPGKRE